MTRECRRSDLESVRQVYALEVLDGTASFEIAPPDLAETTARWQAVRDAGLPYLVAELDGGLAGFAYAGRYRPRPGYRYTCEDSVYVARWARQRGVGRALLDAVVAAATVRGMRQMIAIIGDSAHVASIALHQRAGFRTVGVLENVGFKFQRWLDSVIMQRALGDGAISIPTSSTDQAPRP